MPIVDAYLQELATGVAGALTVSGLALAAAFAKDLYVRRKYPVAGDYLTTFEDTVAGKTVTQTSYSRLKQRGRRLSGFTRLRSGRTWRLDGTLMGIGHISGIYSAEAADDAGVGSFYLRVQGSRLEGLWAGYDHLNRSTTSGRYIFVRLLPIKITSLEPSYVPALLAIGDHVFGPNYVADADLQPNSGYSILTALHAEKVVGFVMGEMGMVSAKVEHNTILQPDIVRAEKDGSVGIIKTLAIAERVQGQGVGDRLFGAMEKHLKSKGATVIVVPAWQDADGVHLAGMLADRGYETFLTCPFYWKNACDAGEFSCRCRKNANQCVCHLVWYKKLLN